MHPHQQHIEKLHEKLKSGSDQIAGRSLALVPTKYDAATFRSHLLYETPKTASLPLETFNRDALPGRTSKFDQGQFGACTSASSVTGYLAKNAQDQGKYTGVLSARFHYAVEKNIDGNPHNAGSSIGNAMAVSAQYGTVLDSDYPYSGMTSDVDLPMPPAALITKAKNYRTKDKLLILSENDTDRKPLIPHMLASLAAGNILEAGIVVCQNFMNVVGPKYEIPLPEGSIEGGHAIKLVDYRCVKSDFSDLEILMWNTWGGQWALNDEAWFPLKWFLEKIDDDYYTMMEVWQALDQVPPALPKRTVALTVGSKTMLVNGQGEPLTVAPRNVSGTVIGPIRSICEALDDVVIWQQADKSVSINADKMTILLHVGSNLALVTSAGGQSQITLPGNVAMSGDTVVGPIRAIVEALKDGTVNWEQSENEVVIVA